MALWGNKDLVAKGGSVTIGLTNEVITGSGTSFTTAGYVVSEGDVIVVGTGATYGHAVIQTVTDGTTASIATTQYLIPHSVTGLIPAGTPYYITQRPISSLEDVNYQAPVVKSNRTSTVYGVDFSEVGAASTTAYAVTHSGWVGVTTYNDCNGNLRVKHEVLVAGGIDFSGDLDAADDTVFRDPVITITTQPADVTGIGTTAAAVFTVVSTVNPTSAPLTYQWTESGSTLSDGGDYSGVTTPVLTVQNDSDKNTGIGYSVIITSGSARVVSAAGTITYA